MTVGKINTDPFITDCTVSKLPALGTPPPFREIDHVCRMSVMSELLRLSFLVRGAVTDLSINLKNNRNTAVRI